MSITTMAINRILYRTECLYTALKLSRCSGATKKALVKYCAGNNILKQETYVAARCTEMKI